MEPKTIMLVFPVVYPFLIILYVPWDENHKGYDVLFVIKLNDIPNEFVVITGKVINIVPVGFITIVSSNGNVNVLFAVIVLTWLYNFTCLNFTFALISKVTSFVELLNKLTKLFCNDEKKLIVPVVIDENKFTLWIAVVLLIFIVAGENIILLLNVVCVPSITKTGFVDTLNWNLLLLKLESKFNISAFWTYIEEYDEDGGIKSLKYKAVSQKIFCVVISDEN